MKNHRIVSLVLIAGKFGYFREFHVWVTDTRKRSRKVCTG
jgi:hypothetical protein